MRIQASPCVQSSYRDGAVTLNFATLSYTDTLDGFRPDHPVTDATITYLVGDGQSRWDAGNVSVNAKAIANGVFSGVDGNYWGTHTFDVTGLISTAPLTTTINDNDPGNPHSPDCLVWAATVLSVTTGTPPAGANQLSRFASFTLHGDVVAHGVGLTSVGQGTIEMSGIPGKATVAHAFLYWATLGNSAQYTSPTLNGRAVNGELTGVSADTCWGVPRNFVYRADVTDIVRGNGSYSIAGLPSSLVAGNNSQGASLVVVYNSPGLYRTIVIDDGAVTLRS